MIDTQLFRDVLGSFPTGVTVVTARDRDGAPFGLTVNAFASVSLDPPQVLVCIDHLASSHDALVEAGSFVVNILARDQAALAIRFSDEPSARRFQDVVWQDGPEGNPLLSGSVSWLACSLEQVHDAGDHSILVGRVSELSSSGREALVFHRGSFSMVTT